ncbi:MAG: nitroreductase family protein [Syntrophaceae bacterium]
MLKDMNRREFLIASAAAGIAIASTDITKVFAQELKPIQLLSPQLDGGRPLMQVLKDRKSWRLYTDEKIPLQVLSNMLWAASGINRPESGKRTAPSGANRQNIDIYVATADGAYFYNAKKNLLDPVLAEDIHSLSGSQFPPAFVPADRVPRLDKAPVNLIYVWDGSKKNKLLSDQENLCYAFVNTGYISQNVYLYCASEGLATVVRSWFDKSALEKKMKLRPEQYAILVQSVGYPGK